MSSCTMLNQLGLKHVFNTGQDEKICFSGQPQDSYFLQKVLHDFSKKQNLFSFTSLMFSHDAYGLRTQTLDKELSKFFEIVSKLQNTITVVMADHGNAYTTFVYLDNEGRYENFHPSLFMILPQGIQKRLRSSAVAALRKNQKRLVTQLDLHHTVKYLADSSYSNRGLLDVVSPARTCNDLPLRQPNLCLCKGSNTPVQNTSEYIGHLDFAVGKLNNIIMNSSPRKCKLLVPIGFDNVIQRHDGSHMSTMFNVITKPGFQSKNDVDRFAVEISSVTSGSVDTFEMKLKSYDRLSSFGGYRPCSDVDYTFRLCICDLKEIMQFKNVTDEKAILITSLGERRTSLSYKLNWEGIFVTERQADLIKNKLLVNIRSYFKISDTEMGSEKRKLIAVSFESVNTSLKRYRVSISFKDLENMKSVIATPCSADTRPNTVIYMCSLAQKYSVWGGSYSYDATYVEVT